MLAAELSSTSNTREDKCGIGAEGSPVYVILWSLHSHGRVRPGGRRRWGTVPRKRAHAYISITVT